MVVEDVILRYAVPFYQFFLGISCKNFIFQFDGNHQILYKVELSGILKNSLDLVMSGYANGLATPALDNENPWRVRK